MYKNVSIITNLKFIICLCLFLCFSYWAQADGNKSILLTGSDHDHVAIPDGVQTGLDISGDMTIGMWIKPTSVVTNMPLVSKWNTSAKTQYILFIEDGELGVHLNSSPSGYGYSTHRADHNQDADEWFHVGLVYKSASGTTELFANGQSLGVATSAPNSISNTNAEFSIGGREDRVVPFTGNIDDVRIWSRALSGSEMNNLYASSTSFSNGSNLQGWWKFEGVLDDDSSNNNDLRFSFSDDAPYAY